MENCGITKTLAIIGSKWTILILRDLFDGKKRFSELEKSLLGISPKTLSVRLQQLERNGIVIRHVYAEVPPHVEYTLTAKGKTLNDIICKLRDWGDTRI